MRSLITILTCTLVMVAAGSSAVLAQSGRRAPKSRNEMPNNPPPSPPSDPPAQAPRIKAEPARLPIIVGGYKLDPSANFSLSFYDLVAGACINRLRESTALMVATGGEMSRGEAINRAKREEESHVVWLELGAESEMGGTADIGVGSVRPTRIYVSYVIFTPGTAKVKSSGRVFSDTAGRVGTGRIGIGLPTRTRGGRLPAQYVLEQTGRDTADRVMNALNIPLPRHP